MSDALHSSREYRFKEFRRYTRTRPYTCQGLMKQFYQCFDYSHFQKNIDEESAKKDCLEKFNFEECLTENKDLLKENWVYHVEQKEEGS